jgi:response regulator RpfG family c-di-GMP phosphodiesterase
MDLKSRVFIIDDDPIHQRIAQIMISKHNLFDEYFSYTEAQKALDFLQENKKNEETLPDVILLDLNMPVIDGWDFLETFETLIKEFKKTSGFLLFPLRLMKKMYFAQNHMSLLKVLFPSPCLRISSGQLERLIKFQLIYV